MRPKPACFVGNELFSRSDDSIDEACSKMMLYASQLVADKIIYDDVVTRIHEHGSAVWRTHLSIVSCSRQEGFGCCCNYAKTPPIAGV